MEYKKQAIPVRKNSRIFFQSESPLFLIDVTGVIIKANAAGRQLFGINKKDKYSGRNIKEFVIPEELPGVLKRIRGSGYRGGWMDTFETKLKVSSKGIISSEITAVLLNGLNPSDKYFVIRAEDVSARSASNETLKKRVEEKDLMLRELHHRVKNSLQTIYSIFNIESRRITDPELLRILEESQDRIRTMSFIHECLYRSNSFSNIQMNEYVKEIVSYLQRAYAADKKGIIIEYGIRENVYLDFSKASPCGLIINEILGNILKCGFENQESGRVSISLVKDSKFYSLRIETDACKGHYSFGKDNSENLSARLISLLTEQLNGELTVEDVPVMAVSVKFPV